MVGVSRASKIACVIMVLVFVGSVWGTKAAYAAPPLALDGVGTHTSNCLLQFCSQLLTTTKGHDVIVVVVETCCTATVSAINDSSGLNFTQRLSYASNSASNVTILEFYALATSPLKSDNISVVDDLCCVTIWGMQVIAVQGANTKAIFDPNPSIPATVSCPGDSGPNTCSASIEASSIDFVIASAGIDDDVSCGSPLPEGGFQPPPGFTNIALNSNFEVDYAITSTPQNNVVFLCNNTDVLAIVVDAISFHGAFGR